ncbi:MAG TPA: aminofutalosine synthase MqnE [Blastocatellia bacterium]|jgi:aminodeoxyfutalosine synthase|nr:aminofutalosine synthase MqnE [Blastocatellia bacterium]
MKARAQSKKLSGIGERVNARERLSFEDGMALFESDDLLAIGTLANTVRERLNGDKTYYNVNRHMNYTNVCVSDCAFCSFYRRVRDPEAYDWSVQECVEIARTAYNEGARELHIVGGLHPRLQFDYYTSLLSELKRNFPGMHLKAFTMVELDHLARTCRMTDEQVIDGLIAAGLDSCPGGGAEIFRDPTRSQICAHKTTGERWLELARKVHERGIHTNATMLYGHVESHEDRVDHLVKLRDLQDQTSGFLCFIPLAFHPQGTDLAHLPGPSAIDSLKTIAVSRLMLDNVPHIKAYWVMLGKNIAQVALRFGADDLDGTINRGGSLMESYLAEGHDNQLTRAEIEELIRGAGRIPIERDTLYNPVGEAAGLEPPGGSHTSLPIVESPSKDKARSPAQG